MIRIRNTANDGFGSSMNESADKLKIDFYESCSVVPNPNDGFKKIFEEPRISGNQKNI